MVSQKGLVLGLLVLTVILGEMFSCPERGSVDETRMSSLLVISSQDCRWDHCAL